MATPFPFVASTVLTAAQLNAITELPTATKTGSYTLVAGDAGSRVIMNVASTNTVTVNNSLFSAGQIVQISNIGAGVTTVTAGGGFTINSADVLTLAQYQGGSLVFSSASAAVWFPTAKTVSAGGLVLLNATTAGSGVSSVAITNVFSSTYDNYKIIVSGGTASAGGILELQMGATTTGYYWIGQQNSSSGLFAQGASNVSRWGIGSVRTAFVSANLDLLAPNLAKFTVFNWSVGVRTETTMAIDAFSGWLNNSTQYTDFTIATNGPTLTGCLISTYGYAKS